MPYIPAGSRQKLGSAIAELAAAIREQQSSIKGATNYAITQLVLGTMKPNGGWNYESLSAALAVFRDAEAEMRRRLLDPYEDDKRLEHGDIQGYARMPGL